LRQVVARELGEVDDLGSNESELFFVMEEYREKSRVRASPLATSATAAA
jgi:hypothetical protein